MESLECSTARPAESASLTNRLRVKEELVLGHELANQLSRVVSNGDFRSAEGLVTKILCSFKNILYILQGSNPGSEDPPEELLSHMRADAIALAPPLPPPRPPPPQILESSAWDAHTAVKRRAAFTDHRGSFKRGKRMTSQAWSRDGPDFNDDGHAWRKYGEKQIQNAIHSRSYFRCTHKYDQDCKAIKQVQKLDDDSQLFRTTYYGNHTCTNSILQAPAFVFDSTSTTPKEASDSKFMLIYDDTSNSLTNNQEQPLFSSTENELMIKSSYTTGSQSSSLLSSGYLVSPDTVVGEPCEPISGMPPQIELDLEDMFLEAEMGHLLYDEEIFPYELW
ncbi:probable WRKY transcription factor 70 [Argentina anserina]|uniref:probable WRKY transcription factor 70 n=1 Tax=Argentina anserina TaxID=57926 RepID=UPI00217626D4|nr:probable WRKY transcription factor 70 [Potentilla anserina]